jgi:hypothetical protein
MEQQFMGLNTRSLLISGAIAGAVMGLLSNLPVVACLNCLLLAWVWGGGIGAVYLYRRYENQAAVTNTQGLVLGAVAGIIGAIVGGIASLVFGGLMASFVGLAANSIGDFGNLVSNTLLSTGFQFFAVIRNIFIYGIIGAIGGIIATALIWKTPGSSVPPYTPPASGPTA